MADLDRIDRELLAEGLDDYVGLWEIVMLDGEGEGAADSALRARVVSRVARVVGGPHVVAGGLLDGGGFEPWELDVPATLERIEREWTAVGRSPSIGDIAWFSNTAAGDELAGSSEAPR